MDEAKTLKLEESENEFRKSGQYELGKTMWVGHNFRQQTCIFGALVASTEREE